jgi:hypothetical protein
MGVVDEIEDKIYHFYGSLRREIWNIFTTKNIIKLIGYSSLLCLQRRNCRGVHRRTRATSAPVSCQDRWQLWQAQTRHP